MKKVKTFMLLIISSVLCSAAVNWVALPNGFVVTGITGLALTVESFTGIHYVAVSYFITFLILIATAIILGKGEVANIIFLSILHPTVLLIMSRINVGIIFEEKLIAAGLFGVMYGIGTGISYRMEYSYGGMDTIGKILKNTLFRAVELRTIMLMADSMIMLLMLTVFSLDSVAYAFIGQLVFVNSMNYVIFNWGPKLYEVQIISNHYEDIQVFMIENIQKSLTIHTVKGGFSGEEKVQVDCVCTSKEYIKLKDFILQQGSDCFIKVVPLMYVFGHHKDFRKLSDGNV